MGESVLNNKRLLAVDDEPDVLETLEEQLSDFDGLIFDRATDYDTGYQLIRSWTYDLVILVHRIENITSNIGKIEFPFILTSSYETLGKSSH